MTSTRNQKAKRSKTRRTRRKTRTVHRGGVTWWPWKKGNAVAPEPTTPFEEVSKLLLNNNYPNTFRCLEAENKIKDINTRYTSQIYPCQSSPAKIEPAPVQEQRPYGLTSQSNPVSEPIYEKYTENNPTRNGWYVVKDSDQHFGPFNILKHATLHNKEDKSECSLAQFGNANVTYYLEFIEKLPNPSDVYIFNDGLGNNKELSLKCENNNRLIWVDNSNTGRIIDTIYYNPENPLTITYQNKDYVLTKK
jgi:hypothetical protein